MPARILTRIALAACLAASWPPIVRSAQVIPQQIPPEVAARRAELERILDQYIAGDHEIVVRTLQKPDSITRSALRLLFSDKEAVWHRGRAAFALELAATASSSFFFDVDGFTRYSRDILARRPSPIGANAADDRFELLCHEVALALFEGAGAWPFHRRYLEAASSRLVKIEAAYPKLSNRIPLMRAMDESMACCGKLIMGNTLPLVTVSVSSDRDPYRGNRPPEPTAESAIALFEGAARHEAMQPEALVRAAYLHERRNRWAQGLAALDRAPAAADPIIDYAAALIRGGLLDRADRPAEAVEAYKSAVRQAPGVQIPAIGLAAALQRAGRIDEAVEAAQHARRIPIGGFDMWPDFLRGDARFAQSWLTQLRSLLK